MPESQFKITWRGKTITIEPFSVKGTTLYKCISEGGMQVLTTGIAAKGGSFWTFIPEGDKDCAKEIGALIDDHEKKLKDNVLFPRD